MRELVVGETLDQYRLTDLLARSGMASIFRATDSEDGAQVALKVPHPQLESDVVFYERFEREERIGQRLDHPSIVKVKTPRRKSRMYLALEFVEGKSLRSIIGEQAPMPAAQALGLACQICEALVYMHGQGIVHRDLKPENVLVSAAGKAKLLDFGIALDESARRLTWVGFSSTIGTPDYMAPEQAAGRRGDARTDVYALGVILFEMLTAQLPHRAANVHAFLRAKSQEEPTAPSYFIPGFDASLEAILLKALARKPRDRYASAAEFLIDLQNPSAVPPYDPTQDTRSRRRPWLPRRLLPALVVGLVIAALASLIWWTSPRGGG